MNSKDIKIPSRQILKHQAKKLAAQTGMKITHAHEQMAKSYGFNSYNHYLAVLAHREMAK